MIIRYRYLECKRLDHSGLIKKKFRDGRFVRFCFFVFKLLGEFAEFFLLKKAKKEEVKRERSGLFADFSYYFFLK